MHASCVFIFRIMFRLLSFPPPLLLLLLLLLLFLLCLLLVLRLRLHLRHVLCLLRLLLLLSEMSPEQNTPNLNRAISHRSGTPVWPRREREAFTIFSFHVFFKNCLSDVRGHFSGVGRRAESNAGNERSF